MGMCRGENNDTDSYGHADFLLVWPNIPCDSHCLPDCLLLIIQIDHNSLSGRVSGGGGFVGLGWLGKGIWKEEGEWVFIASACSLAFQGGSSCIYSNIEFNCVSTRILNFKRPINGIPGMQEHDQLCKEHVKCTLMKSNSVCNLCNAKKSEAKPISLLCPGYQCRLVSADPKAVCCAVFLNEEQFETVCCWRGNPLSGKWLLNYPCFHATRDTLRYCKCPEPSVSYAVHSTLTVGFLTRLRQFTES